MMWFHEPSRDGISIVGRKQLFKAGTDTRSARFINNFYFAWLGHCDICHNKGILIFSKCYRGQFKTHSVFNQSNYAPSCLSYLQRSQANTIGVRINFKLPTLATNIVVPHANSSIPGSASTYLTLNHDAR